MEPQPATEMSMERSFELAKMLGMVDNINDIEGLKEVLKETLKLNMNLKCHYESLLAQEWGL